MEDVAWRWHFITQTWCLKVKKNCGEFYYLTVGLKADCDKLLVSRLLAEHVLLANYVIIIDKL